MKTEQFFIFNRFHDVDTPVKEFKISEFGRFSFSWKRCNTYLSSSGIWRAIMEMASSHKSDQPLISDNFKAWIFKSTLGTLDHWLGLRHWTFNRPGNCGTLCFPEFNITADDNGKLLDVLPNSNCSASLEVALTKIAGNNLVPGSILNLCLVSLPSQVKLTMPVEVSIKHPMKRPVEGALPDGSWLTSA